MPPTKIVVAFDPFHGRTAHFKNAVETIANYASAVGAEVYVVAAISPNRVSWPKSFDDSWIATFRKIGEHALQSALGSASAPGSWKTSVVLESAVGSRASAHSILKYAQAIGAETIAVIARHEGGHLFGGFINHLVGESRIPILIVNETSGVTRSFKRLLFASDLKESGKESFQRTLRLAKKLEAEVHLLHVLISPPSELAENIGLVGGWPNFEKFMIDQETEAKALTSEWLKEPLGVTVKPALIPSNKGLSETVLSVSRDFECDLILLRAETTPLSAALLGSHSRNVIRRSDKLVLLFKD